jgi:hypothetical protein
MSLTKTVDIDRIEVIRKWNIQVREATDIKEDSILLARIYKRKLLTPGVLDASDNLVETDISGEPTEVQDICNAAWTDSVKNNYRTHLINRK